MSFNRPHGSRALRNALIRVFILPQLSAPCQLATVLVRDVHFGSASDLTQQLDKRKLKVHTPKLHPDIIEADFFPTISLVPQDSSVTGLQARISLPQLRQQLRRANAARSSTSEHEHIIMLKAPTYQTGQEPSAEHLTKLRAPQMMIKMLADLQASSSKAVTPQSGARLRLPIPVEEPLVKIMTGLDLMKYRNSQERLEREAIKRERQEKEIELTWTVKDNDLVWSLNKIKQWLSEGVRVSVSLTRKRRWLNPDPEVCLGLIEKIRKAVSTIPDVKERNMSKTKPTDSGEAQEAAKDLRGLGHTMTLYFTPKAKSPALDQATNMSIPWSSSESQLQQHLKAVAATLKKGRNLRIVLEERQDIKSKDSLEPQVVFYAVRSQCRQSKEVVITQVDGDAIDGTKTVTIDVQAGLAEGSTREIELCSDFASKDAELCIKWIEEWLSQGKEISVWVDAGSNREASQFFLSQRLPGVAFRDGQQDEHGQRRLVLSKIKSNAPQTTQPLQKSNEVPISKVEAIVERPKTDWRPQRAMESAFTRPTHRVKSASSLDLLRDLKLDLKDTNPPQKQTVHLLKPEIQRARSPEVPVRTERSQATGNNVQPSKPQTMTGIEELLKSVSSIRKPSRQPAGKFGRRF